MKLKEFQNKSLQTRRYVLAYINLSSPFGSCRPSTQAAGSAPLFMSSPPSSLPSVLKRRAPNLNKTKPTPG